MKTSDYPHPATAAVSQRMRRNRGAETRPEIAVRKALHGRGLRFRKGLPIKAGEVRVRPDVVFTRARVAVFIDGCYWHRCPHHGTTPTHNGSYWQSKLDSNVERDRRVDAALSGAGWTVLRHWEHEAPEEVADAVGSVVRAARDA
jgi:DNA mismatch endonuclease, patch repair protein